MAATIKRIEVTSSTSAADTEAATIRTTMMRLGCGPTTSSRRSMTNSKKCRSSRKPMIVIIAMRKRMMSSPANSTRWGMSSSPRPMSSAMPRQAKARRKRQKKIAP